MPSQAITKLHKLRQVGSIIPDYHSARFSVSASASSVDGESHQVCFALNARQILPLNPITAMRIPIVTNRQPLPFN